MIDVRCDKTGFEALADGYRFAFSGDTFVGTLSAAEGEPATARISFGPLVDGVWWDGLEVVAIRAEANEVEVEAKSGSKKMLLRFELHDSGLVYRYTLSGVDEIGVFQPGRIEGEFRQVHNFDPDLPCFDIPEKVATKVQISSRRKEYDEFFQLDQGNYMMPAYLLAFSTAERLVGVGLLDVPETAVPYDAAVAIDGVGLRFDYGSPKQSIPYVSPRVGLYLGDCRTDVLAAYRDSIGNRARSKKNTLSACWRGPIYTTWGDQVYRKHLAVGEFTSEAGSEKYLTASLVDEALEKLATENIHPRTIVLDEGWSLSLGDWDAADEKFNGSLKQYIASLQAGGHRVVLHFNPFLVSRDAAIASTHPEFLVTDSEQEPATVVRSGREYFLFDWSCREFREHVREKLSRMVAPAGLGADGIKISGTKFLPPSTWRPTDESYGMGERYLLAALRDVHRFVKQADSEAPIFLACLNPLFAGCFDIVRLGNTSEVNHDVYVLRAETASWLMPDKPIDTDDWAAYQKVIGATTFIKALSGIPNLFSAFYRGDGRLRFQGAMGGCPVRISGEQYRILSAAWKLYELSTDAGRGELHVDYDRMEFHTQESSKVFVRTYQGGNILAVYCGKRGKEVFLASLLDAKAIIDLPDGFVPAGLERIDRTGARQPVAFRKVLDGRLLFDVQSSRDETFYYHLKGVE